MGKNSNHLTIKDVEIKKKQREKKNNKYKIFYQCKFNNNPLYILYRSLYLH